MKNLTINGEIIAIDAETQIPTKSGGVFLKRDIVVLERGEREDTELPITFTGPRVSLLDDFAVGEPVCVCFDLRARKWQGSDGATHRAITADGWRIEKG